MTIFRVGQKVACIADDWETIEGAGNDRSPVKGAVYTIDAVVNRPDGVFLGFEEIGPSHGFCSSGFRPLVTRNTDISVFKAMLNPSKVKETLDV